MTTPTSHPRRGRMTAAAIAAVVLVVAGSVLLATAGPSQPAGSAQAIAGAPNPTTSLPDTPGSSSPLAGAATAGGPVSTPGSEVGTPSGPAVPVPSSDPGAPPATSGVPAPGTAPGQPGSASGPGSTVPGNPGGTDAGGPSSGAGPGQPGSSSNAAPGDAAGNPGTGGGGSGVSDAARTAALAGAPTLPPNTLSLPSLGVGPTPLGPVCSEPGGSLEPPVNPLGMLCTWRGSSPAAASSGETTVAGHINNGRIPGAAFAKLAQMHVGDPIYLRGATGGTQVWITRSEFARSKTLPLDNNAFVGPDGPRSLVLLSCGGALIPGERSYADNIYVYASLA